MNYYNAMPSEKVVESGYTEKSIFSGFMKKMQLVEKHHDLTYEELLLYQILLVFYQK